MRTFRVDRIEGEVARGEAGDAVVPDDVNVDVKAALPEEPWEVEGEDRVDMRVRVDALEARRVVDEVGADKVVHRHEDGSVDLELGVSSFASIRSWLLGLLDHVVITEPDAFRQRADRVARRRWRPHRRRSPPRPACPNRTRWRPTMSRRPGRSAPGRETSRRLRRLLALVGWLAQVGEAPIADAAQRFGMSEKELVAELELAACCGIPPYTPDTLMEIEVSEHSVRAFLPAEYARPRRLTPAEGFAVAASARLLLTVPGSEDGRAAPAPWPSSMPRSGSREAVGVDVDAPAHLAAVRDAADAGQALEIDYLSGSRDELTTRIVEPVQVATIDGHWYLDAYCHRAGDMRRFRVDRIDAVRQPAAEPRAGGQAVTAAGRDVRSRARCGRGPSAARPRRTVGARVGAGARRAAR